MCFLGTALMHVSFRTGLARSIQNRLGFESTRLVGGVGRPRTDIDQGAKRFRSHREPGASNRGHCSDGVHNLVTQYM